MTDVESLARARLRSLRTTLGYSLDELAARTNLSPSTISRVETGKRALALDVLVPLAGALQVSLDTLLMNAWPKHPQFSGTIQREQLFIHLQLQPCRPQKLGPQHKSAPEAGSCWGPHVGRQHKILEH